MSKYFVVEIESFEGDDTTVDVNGPSGSRTWAIGSLQNGVIILDDYGYDSIEVAQDAVRNSLAPPTRTNPEIPR